VRSVVHPEDEADDDREREVEEVKDHPGPVPDRDPGGIVEPVLKRYRRQRAGENGPLQTRDVVDREARLSGEPSHDLVAEEEDQEGQPVGQEGTAAAKRDGDQQQRQDHPLGLDRDAPPEHDAEDQPEVEDDPQPEQPAIVQERRGFRSR